MNIVEYPLSKGEYYEEVVKKDTIFIHHTAGSHRPDYTIEGWEKDRAKSGEQLPVATAYVIGGLSTSSDESKYDGLIYRTFDDKFWAHHLGLKQLNNKTLNQKSIAIEICNYGPLTKTKTGVYLNYVNKEIPASMVGELNVPFRGFKYYQKYTDKQIIALKELLLSLSVKYGIDLKKGLNELTDFSLEVNLNATIGKPGLWSHSSVRSDKFDVWPQPELIGLIQSFK